MVPLQSEAAFNSIYKQHHGDVLAYFLRRLDAREAEEAAAEVFVVAWRRIADVPTGAEARPWLFGVAHNVLRNRQRALRRVGRLLARLAGTRNEQPPIPEAVVLRRAEDQAVLDLLERLRPIDREVLRLRLWEDATFGEIASVMDCSRHAAEQRYRKALIRLRSISHGSGHVLSSGTATDDQRQERTSEA
jgi:RNA polymerase sigma-70 factor (ECF subfamily)